MQELSVPVSEAIYTRYSELNTACWKALERGEISREELKVKRFAALTKEYGIPFAPAEINSRYIDNLAKQNVLYPGAVDRKSVV